MRYGFVVSLAVLLAACGDASGPGPGSSDGVVVFDLGDGGGFSASGDLELDQGIPIFGDWAVAADPDSLGGLVITAFQASDTAGRGDLFVLQLHPAREGAFTPCGSDQDCHGRLFLDWRLDFAGYGDWFEIVSGSVEVEELTGSRVRGSFSFTLRDDGGAGSTVLAIEAGSFDVPVDERVGGLLCSIPPSAGCLFTQRSRR